MCKMKLVDDGTRVEEVTREDELIIELSQIWAEDLVNDNKSFGTLFYDELVSDLENYLLVIRSEVLERAEVIADEDGLILRGDIL